MNQRRSIPRQAFLRLIFSLGLFVVLLGYSSYQFYSIALQKSANERAADLATFYQSRLEQLERDWEIQAQDFKVRIEVTRLLEDQKSSTTNLQAFMTVQGTNRRFQYLLIQSAQGNKLFDFGATLDLDAIPVDVNAANGWYQSPKTKDIYRVFLMPIWLGERGMGRMAVFYQIDNRLLFNLASPGVGLAVSRAGVFFASSSGQAGVERERQSDTIITNSEIREISWGSDSGGNLSLRINAPIKVMFTRTELALSAATIPVIDGLVLWFTLGIWLMRNASRIKALGDAVQEFSRYHQLNSTMEESLKGAYSTRIDEISDVANTIEDMARQVQLRELELRQLTDRLSLATSAGGVGIWDYDVVNNTLTWDDQMFALYGVNREQFSGAYEAWRAGLYPEDEARGDLEIQMALRGEKDFNTEFRVLKPDGTIRFIRALAKVQRDEHGKSVRMIGTNWDITSLVQSRADLLAAKLRADDSLVQQQKLQDDLVQAEKLAALGGLVAGVAHEVNTPVGITLSAATHLSAQTKKTDALYQAGELTEEGLAEYFATAQQASQLMTINSRRAADLIQSFKQIAVDQAGGEMRDFDLAEYLNEILLSLGPKLRKRNMAVKTDCPARISLHGLPGALAQVLTNLIMNSLLHGYNEDQPGQIEIAVHDTGDNIELVYHDDGKGIPLEFHHKIFDPFFTTARGKGGSGLGLHIVYNIVTQMLHGSIEMQSAPGQGATFILNFPRSLAE